MMADCIIGSSAVDWIEGYEGDDEIEGGGSGDRIYGGDGDDVISGGDGDDRIDGQNDDDIIYGDAGTDDLAGGDGDDYLFGGENAATFSWLIESLNGEDGNDVLIGGAGNDRLVGGDDGRNDPNDPDDDYLVGTDYTAGGLGEIDYLRGGRGADTFVLGEVRSTLQQDDLRLDELTGQTVRQKTYYVDGAFKNGNDSYAVIEDFRIAQGDTLQLIDPAKMGGIYSAPQSYVVGPSPIPNVPGSAIYLQSNWSFFPDDLIAVVQFGVNAERQVNLGANYISYVGDPPPPLEFEPFPLPFPVPIEPYDGPIGTIIG